MLGGFDQGGGEPRAVAAQIFDLRLDLLALRVRRGDRVFDTLQLGFMRRNRVFFVGDGGRVGRRRVRRLRGKRQRREKSEDEAERREAHILVVSLRGRVRLRHESQLGEAAMAEV